MVCEIITDFPERFASGVEVFVDDPPRVTTILSARCDARTVTLKLEHIASRDEVERLRGSWVLVRESEAYPLPDGRYYWHQLIGLRVVTDTGDELGVLVDILETGSNHVYVVKHDGRELLLPAIPDVIVNVDLDEGTLTVHLLPGLESL
jgi:16S rRNA processing protein RimM